ncbi:DPH4 homolog [Anopheles ziemanni]|uniref:DPH4 homolog n=1 Tax=Anopheles coustani TaxID=139045 RepID=UPI002657D25E|nr:DPH4 homolog [Anopheles coustani]XP_058173459.1 DPH4 homolog [Anopheles ziemanni]
MANQKDLSHYDVLQVPQNASHEEIRKSYQALVLQHHPDKQRNRNANDSELFMRIDEAWKILRDEQTRRVYDAELMQQMCREEYFVNEVLREVDFEINHEENYRYHTCRCGGFYILPEESPLVESIYISCDECSLIVQVNPP